MVIFHCYVSSPEGINAHAEIAPVALQTSSALVDSLGLLVKIMSIVRSMLMLKPCH